VPPTLTFSNFHQAFPDIEDIMSLQLVDEGDV
jgi:hypothetical protein